MFKEKPIIIYDMRRIDNRSSWKSNVVSAVFPVAMFFVLYHYLPTMPETPIVGLARIDAACKKELFERVSSINQKERMMAFTSGKATYKTNRGPAEEAEQQLATNSRLITKRAAMEIVSIAPNLRTLEGVPPSHCDRQIQRLIIKLPVNSF